MFIELVESDRKVRRAAGGTLVSVALHTALISLAIAATANARTERPKQEHIPGVVYMPQQPQAVPRRRSNPVQRSAHTVPTVPQIPSPPIVAPVTVATSIPAIEPVGSVPMSPAGMITGIGEPSSGSESPAIIGPYTQFQVDKEVRAFPSNRPPIYPDALRSRGVEGEVHVRFVVDIAGRVEMNSVEILSASNPTFVNAVRYSLERARFQPAEAAGRKVAQLVEQHFQFRLDR